MNKMRVLYQVYVFYFAFFVPKFSCIQSVDLEVDLCNEVVYAKTSLLLVRPAEWDIEDEEQEEDDESILRLHCRQVEISKV
jgi:hypothetical protein